MSNTYGFKDMRSPAELILAPGRPLQRTVVDFTSLIGGAKAAAQVTGAMRATFQGIMAIQQATAGVALALKATTTTFNTVSQSTLRGTTPTLDPIFYNQLTQAGPGTLPNAQAFAQVSSLRPGVPSVSSAIIMADRMVQLESLYSRVASNLTQAFRGGVAIRENYAKTPYPLASDIDKPSAPKLAIGGSIALVDDILRDKQAFLVAGVPIAAGKPSFWSRLASVAQIAHSPAMNAVVGQIFKDRTNSRAWSEPPSPYAAQYPYNKVQETESGHIFEMDDTPGAERIHLFHRSGSFVEIHPDGTVVYKSMKDGYQITMNDQFVKVTGACNIYVGGKTTIYSQGDVNLQTDGEMNMQVAKDFNVFADNINLRAKSTFKADGTTVDLRYINLPKGIGVVMEGFMVPRVNLTALSADFPSGNFSAVMAEASMGKLDPNTINNSLQFAPPNTLPVTPPPQSPLSNPAVYTAVSAAAVVYRAHLFDTPAETNQSHLYSAHIELQNSLGDTSTANDPRQLGGTLTVPTYDTKANASVRHTRIFLDYANYSGTYDYANTYVLANTAFMLQDVVDTVITPDVVAVTIPPVTVAVGTLVTSGTSASAQTNQGGTGGTVAAIDRTTEPQRPRGRQEN